MASYVYFLKHKTRPLVKIGKADDVSRRIYQMGEELVDVAGSFEVELPCGRSARFVEAMLHRILSDERSPLEESRDGSTEWFRLGVMPEVERIVPSIRPLSVTIAEDRVSKPATVVDAVRDSGKRDAIRSRLMGKGQVYSDIWDAGVSLGVKPGELLSLRFDDFEGEALKVHGFNKMKPREVSIPDSVRRIVARRRRENPGHVFLFQSSSNRARGLSKARPINRTSVSRVFKEVGGWRPSAPLWQWSPCARPRNILSTLANPLDLPEISSYSSGTPTKEKQNENHHRNSSPYGNECDSQCGKPRA